MGTSAFSGPVWSTGLMDYLTTVFGGTGFPVPDYNPDASPSIFYQGTGQPDVRFILEKNKLNGFTGVQPAFRHLSQMESVNCVPAAFGTAKIVAAAHTTTGTALTLVAANAAGITRNVPIVQWAQSGTANAINSSRSGSGVVTAPIVLDFGFAFLNLTSGSATAVCADSTAFYPGMPLVIGGGGANATTALLTWVISITDATHIVLNDKAGNNNATAPVGHGNVWPGAPLQTPQYPTAAVPYLPGGPALFLSGGESLARGVSVTTVVGGTGGNVVVSGWDIYGQIMNETIAASATISTTVYGLKAFKAIKSVTPAFTDGTGTYSVGTSDNFGFNLRADRWELTAECWAGATVTASTGFTGWVAAASGDVRGTMQVSAQGPLGTGVSTNNSNGTITSLVMTGRRYFASQALGLSSAVLGTPLAPQTVFGPVQT